MARCQRPVFLRDYPLSQAALARPSAAVPGYAERAELYVAGIELCNAYGELCDVRENRNRLRAESERRKLKLDEDAPLDRRFLDALAEGLPFSAGNALGFDRLLALALNTGGVSDVQTFSSASL